MGAEEEVQSQEALLEEQKANCIFCKIVKNELSSKQVYEDKEMLAILDIRPAVKGHSLLLPKEHYPIMPIIPPEIFKHIFGQVASLSGAIVRGMLAERCTLFIANGAVAGQQSPHFLFHLIPREEGDGLENFNIPIGSVEQKEIVSLLRQNLSAIMKQHLQRFPIKSVQTEKNSSTTSSTPSQPPRAPTEAPVPVSMPASTPSVNEEALKSGQNLSAWAASHTSTPHINTEQLAQIIEQTPELKAILINNPTKLKTILEQNPQLQPLFAGVDIQKLGEELRRQILGSENQEEKAVDENEKGEATNDAAIKGNWTEENRSERNRSERNRTEEKQGGGNQSLGNREQEDIIPARDLTLSQLFAFIEQKPKLKELILQAPERLKAMIPGNERLRLFFEGSDVNAIIEAYRAHHEQMKNENEKNENGKSENEKSENEKGGEAK